MGITNDTALLRFSTAGSVDDGKSTLIGRLLLDAHQVMEDQLSNIAEVSLRRGFARTELGLLTDGLRAEREQGITIDVAYRFFGTPRRRFVVADTPGHAQYTRNMVTGASTADVVVLLVDARQGVVEQTRRHAFVSSRLGVRRFVFCVNKMDLVGWAEDRFREIEREVVGLLPKHDRADVHVVPVSALLGDNVVTPSTSMPWYDGPTLLEALETAPAGTPLDEQPFRFPVQWVIRPGSDAHHDFRAYAGRVASGRVRVGEAIELWPSRRRTRVARIELDGSERATAAAGDSINLHLADDVDVTRGDLLAAVDDPPRVERELSATLCWFADAPLEPRKRYLLKHGTRTVSARVDRVHGAWDMRSLRFSQSAAGGGLAMNDIGIVDVTTSSPLVHHPYERLRGTGSFILIDESENGTVAAGLIDARVARDGAGR